MGSQTFLILHGKLCAYCKRPTELVDSKVIYGKSYGLVYRCSDCEAHVGVHKGTKKALGRVAKRDLREAKKEAHKYFDNLWRRRITGSCTKKKARGKAYNWLSEQMGIEIKFTHIGMFDLDQCKKVVELCKPYFK